MTSSIQVQHAPENRRFEATVEGLTAFSEYILARDRIFFTHTEVPQGLEGKGIASSLAQTGLEFAREKGLKVAPLCPFVAAYMSRHSEYHDLLAPGYHITKTAPKDP